MDKKTTAQEIGARIRKFRNFKGWSQKDLGEKICTTSAAISKYEKDGVSNIEVIQELSKVLEVDLLIDEMDVIEEISEIGLEILSLIINSNEYLGSYIVYEKLVNDKSLYGLGKDRIIHELAKLEKNGLCVRERFKDFSEETNDFIFITAKGVISLKRRCPELGIEIRNRIMTYEKYCCGKNCIQDYIDGNPIQKKLQQIERESAFRVNFFEFAGKTINKPYWGKDCYRKEERIYGNSIFFGYNCYFDILYSMLLKLNREEADYFFIGPEITIPEDEEEDFLDRVNHPEKFKEENKNTDRLLLEADLIYYLMDEFGEMFDVWPTENKDDLGFLIDGKTSEPYEWHYKGFGPEEGKELLDRKLESIRQIDHKVDIRKMFSKEEILEWVEKNVLKPQNQKEEDVQMLMEELLKNYAFLREYFLFPESWEENGLADAIRSAYGITDIMSKEYAETDDSNSIFSYTNYAWFSFNDICMS